MAKPRDPKKNADGWYHIGTRIDDEELAALTAYRDRHGLTSLNGAVRHWLKMEGANHAKAVAAVVGR